MTVTSGAQAPESLSHVPHDAVDEGSSFGHLATRQICPFLTIDGGGWRSSSPSRDHRCGGVTPAVPLAMDKQRRLCLTDTHLACATYLAATGASASGEMAFTRAGLGRPGAAATPTVTRWSLVRTVPVVLDRTRVPAVGAIARDRRGGQLALAGLLFAAIAAFAVARLSGVGGPGQSGAVESRSPSPSPTMTAAPATTAPTAQPTAPPSAQPTVVPSAAPTVAPTAAPTAAHRTYTVQSGDTLTKIANQFGTTVQAIADLNNIPKANWSKLYVGQVLKIP